MEQDDYCDFAVQFEIAHNEIHWLVGGFAEKSMASLHYASFDPIFYLVHSYIDKLFVIWQKLQEYRGKPGNIANCALSLLNEPMKPFSYDLNRNSITHDHSKPSEAFDNKKLGYR